MAQSAMPTTPAAEPKKTVLLTRVVRSGAASCDGDWFGGEGAPAAGAAPGRAEELWLIGPISVFEAAVQTPGLPAALWRTEAGARGRIESGLAFDGTNAVRRTPKFYETTHAFGAVCGRLWEFATPGRRLPLPP
jgi:hypothetical protein